MHPRARRRVLVPLALALSPAAALLLVLLAGCGGGEGAGPPPGVRVTTASLPDAATGRAYEARIEAEGRHPPVTLRRASSAIQRANGLAQGTSANGGVVHAGGV